MNARDVPMPQIAEELSVRVATVGRYLRGQYQPGRVREQHKAAMIARARVLAGDGVPLQDIMDSVGIKSAETMSKYLREAGIEYLTRAQVRRKERRDEALRLYKSGMTVSNMARRFNIHPTGVYSLLPRDVRRRVLRPSRRIYKTKHGMSRKRPPVGRIELIDKPARPVRPPQPKESVRSLFDRGIPLARIAELRGRTLQDVGAALRASYADNVEREPVDGD